MENNYYSVKDISKLTGLTKRKVYSKIKKLEIKPDLIKLSKGCIQKKFYLKKNISKHFNILEITFIPKIEKKKNFEFSFLTLESKINGTN